MIPVGCRYPNDDFCCGSCGPPESVSDRLGAAVRAARRSRGWSSAQLAERCRGTGLADMTAAVIGNIETGRRGDDGVRRRVISVDELVAIAAALAVAPQDLAPQVVAAAEEGPVEKALRVLGDRVEALEVWRRGLAYFWLPCPSCGRYFGGHEAGPWSMPNPNGRGGLCICRACGSAQPGVVIEVPGVLTDAEFSEFVARWRDSEQGGRP